MIDQLRTIGIEKGKPFTPDDATKKALEAGVAEAKALLAARYDSGFPAFFEGTHWMTPTLPETIKGPVDRLRRSEPIRRRRARPRL